MIRYIIYFLGNIVLSLACYLTNPIAVLFSDEEGELPWILKGWQTWDDSLDVDWFVKEAVPEVFRYDFDSKYEHYTGTSESLQKHGRVRTIYKTKRKRRIQL